MIQFFLVCVQYIRFLTSGILDQTVRHATETGSGLLGEIPRVVVQWVCELIIITILHIIIIATSILNLDSKTFAPKILAHTTCINRY